MAPKKYNKVKSTKVGGIKLPLDWDYNLTSETHKVTTSFLLALPPRTQIA